MNAKKIQTILYLNIVILGVFLVIYTSNGICENVIRYVKKINPVVEISYIEYYPNCQSNKPDKCELILNNGENKPETIWYVAKPVIGPKWPKFAIWPYDNIKIADIAYTNNICSFIFWDVFGLHNIIINKTDNKWVPSASVTIGTSASFATKGIKKFNLKSIDIIEYQYENGETIKYKMKIKEQPSIIGNIKSANKIELIKID